MLVSVACLVVRRLLSCLVVLARSEVSSDAGLLVVRHENAVLPHFAHADEQLLYTLATQILRDQFVDTETFDAALAEWGEAGLVDIIGCLGNFAMLAMLLNTFQPPVFSVSPE